MRKPVGVGFGERCANLAQQKENARLRLRAVAFHKGLQVEAVQQFHYVIENAVVGDAVIVKGHGVWRMERSRGLSLELEAAACSRYFLLGGAAERFTGNDLDSRHPC